MRGLDPRRMKKKIKNKINEMWVWPTHKKVKEKVK